MGEEAAPIVDFADVRSRLDSVGAAWRLAFIMAAAGLGYCAATPQQPHRLAIAGLFAALALLGLLILALPAERLVRSRRSDLLFLGWSVLNVGVIAAAVALDGGASSSLSLLFFLPLLLAALSYPLAAVVAIGALTELAYVGSSLLDGVDAQVQLDFFSVCLACAAVVCALHARDIERRRLELDRASRTDPLTGAFNRRGFIERLEAELSAGSQGRPFTLMAIDIDDFKTVNETSGHAAGDDLLRWVVESLDAETGPLDIVGRLGGDEFALLLPGTVKYDAHDLAHRVRDRIGERAPSSVGIAAYPEDGADSETLQRYADHELRARKPVAALREPGRSLPLSWATAFASSVDLRMAGHEHSFAVSDYAAGIGGVLGLSSRELESLRLAAVLHDIGKVTVPDRVLRKAGPLTPEEWALIVEHPVAGARTLQRIEGMEEIAECVLRSHEHYDGSGYPDGMSGTAIPLQSRILLVADAYDAMTSDRPYRDALPHEHAINELRECAGTQFDPDCVAALVTYLDGRVTPSGKTTVREASHPASVSRRA